MQEKICSAAANMKQGPAGPTFSDVLGSAAGIPDATVAAKKSRGTTFDTLSGNALAR